MTSRRAGSRRCPSSASRSTVDGSLQCRSSSTSTSVDVGGQRLGQGRELAQHALGAGRLQRVPQRLGIVADQPRHLRQPRGRDAAQQLAESVRIGPPRQPFQRLEHRHVGLARPVLLDTGAACDPHRRHGAVKCRRIEKGLDQRRLADSRRAGDEDDLPLARARLREAVGELLDLGGAADERLRAAVTGSPAPACGRSPAPGSVWAMKRNPRRWTVSMKRGVAGSSPSARRSSPMDLVSVSGVTATSGQTASSNSSLVTSTPGRSARYSKTAHVFGRSGIGAPARVSWPPRRSSRNEEKTIDCEPSPDFAPSMLIRIVYHASGGERQRGRRLVVGTRPWRPGSPAPPILRALLGLNASASRSSCGFEPPARAELKTVPERQGHERQPRAHAREMAPRVPT